MIKRYILPAVTIDGQDTSIEIAVDDVEKLRTWLRDVKRLGDASPFGFQWARRPRATMHQLLGAFCVDWRRRDGIYVQMMLHHENYFGRKYPLDEFCRMLFKSERPAFGWRITVTVQ